MFLVLSSVTKKVTQARKGLGTNSVGLTTELSLVSWLLQKEIPKKVWLTEMANKEGDEQPANFLLSSSPSFMILVAGTNKPAFSCGLTRYPGPQ